MNTSKYVPQPSKTHDVPLKKYTSVISEDLDISGSARNRDQNSSESDMIFTLDESEDSVHCTRTPLIKKNPKNSSTVKNIKMSSTPTVLKDNSVQQEIQKVPNLE